jgi:hypothetical protein
MPHSPAIIRDRDQPLSRAESFSPLQESDPEPKRGGASVWFLVGLVELVIFVPFLTSGTVLFLDYSDYPIGSGSHLGAYAWGFAPGLTSRAAVNALLLGVFRFLPWGPVKLLPLLLLPPLAAWGFSRLFSRRPLATIAATLLFVVNPFVYERILAGQIYLVLGYALLPLFLSLLLSKSEDVAAPIVAGLLFALLMGLSPHFAFLGGLLLFVAVGVSLGRAERRRAIRRAGITLLVAILASLYWLIPIATRTSDLGRVTGTDLETFRTVADPAFGLAANVAGLYGFWRAGPPLPKESLPAWPLLLGVIIIVVAIGTRAAGSFGYGKVAKILIVGGVSAFILALGAQGPTAGVFRFLFEHVPGFRIMREPQKFGALLALGYAGLFGLGAYALVKASTQRAARAVVAIVILAVPCAYTFRMLWGFGGYARPSSFPTSWTEADALMGNGPGKVLALPGDQYLSFPWTQQRAVASPVGSFFERDVLIDGRLRLGGLESQTADPRTRYLRFIADHGSRTTSLGNLVAPLGVQYVLLVKTGDWERYSWLEDQTDLRLVRSWPDLELFENVEPVSSAYAPQRLVTVQDWGEVVGLAQRARLSELAVTVRDPGPGPIRVPDVTIPSRAAGPVTLLRTGPVGSDIASSGGGWIALTQPFDPAWRLDGKPPRAQLGVTDLFEAPSTPGLAEVRYSRWPLVRLCYALSAASILVALLVAIGAARRSRSRRVTPGAD